MSLTWTLRERMPKNGERDGAYRFNAIEAESAVRWFEKYLHIPEGPRYGKPFRLEPWQADIIRARYGWRTMQGNLRYTKVFVFIPRGNGKSSLGAGFGLKALIGEGLPTPKIYGAGTDKENAAIIFGHASSMVDQDRRLTKRLSTIPSTKRIVRKDGQGFYVVISRDTKKGHGIHPTDLIIDDLQAIEAEYYKLLRSSQITRDDARLEEFMTAGFAKEGPGWDRYNLARRVLEDPSVSEEQLVVLYELPENADWTDPANWRIANPNLGVSVSEKKLREAVDEAVAIPSNQNAVLTYNFNRWVEQVVRWLPIELWDSCGQLVPREDLIGREYFTYVDLATVTDIAALAHVFPPTKDKPWDVVWDFFVPADNVQGRANRDKIPYDLWIDQGWIEATHGDVIDYDAVEKALLRRTREWKQKPKELIFDPWQAQHFAQDMAGKGITTIELANTGRNMNLGVKEVERQTRSKGLRHGGNPVMRWMINNAAVLENSSGERKIDKRQSREKVDGVVALVGAMARAMVHVEAPKQRLGAM